MLPGHVSGFYDHEECHIDLTRLAHFAKVRLLHASADAVDTARRRVGLAGGRPPIAYDVLSIDVGITPSAFDVPGTLDHTTPVKPISKCVAAKLC